MAEIGKRIKAKREELSMTQEELASKLGYKSKTTIAKIENGTNDIVQSKVIEFANALNTTPAYLMGWEQVDSHFAGKEASNKVYQKFSSNISQHMTSKKGVTINVLGSVAAGIPINAIEDVIDTEEITEKLAKTGEFFGLRIKGDSMSPIICNGDIVIVRQQDDAESGDTVIVTINGDEATCKRLRKYKDGIELISNNPGYAPFEFSNEEIEEKPVKVIGKVVELRRKF